MKIIVDIRVKLMKFEAWRLYTISPEVNASLSSFYDGENAKYVK